MAQSSNLKSELDQMKTQRCYRAYLFFGELDELEEYIHKISNYVKQKNLSDVIPRVCYGYYRTVNKRKCFYLFIGINIDENGHIADRVSKLFHILHAGSFQYMRDFQFDQVKATVPSKLKIVDYTRRITYTYNSSVNISPKLDEFEDPFTLYPFPTTSSSEKTEMFNQLLYWLSFVGYGTWQSFKKICQYLGLIQQSIEARHIFRRLRLLGHVEYYDNGRKWTICPACLVQASYPQSHKTYFLSGQRTPKLIEALKRHATVDIVLQPEGNAPACVRVVPESDSHAKELILTSHITQVVPMRFAGEASSLLASILPDLSGYQDSLTSLRHVVTSMYQLQKWRQDGFIECPFQREIGMYQFTLNTTSDYKLFPFTLFYDPQKHIWLQGDWYGLRYLAKYYDHESCDVFYNTPESCFAIPTDYRWPDLYERALVLASGLLPESQGRWLYYGKVSQRVRKMLIDKLAAYKVEQ